MLPIVVKLKKAGKNGILWGQTGNGQSFRLLVNHLLELKRRDAKLAKLRNFVDTVDKSELAEPVKEAQEPIQLKRKPKYSKTALVPSKAVAASSIATPNKKFLTSRTFAENKTGSSRKTVAQSKSVASLHLKKRLMNE